MKIKHSYLYDTLERRQIDKYNTEFPAIASPLKQKNAMSASQKTLPVDASCDTREQCTFGPKIGDIVIWKHRM